MQPAGPSCQVITSLLKTRLCVETSTLPRETLPPQRNPRERCLSATETLPLELSPRDPTQHLPGSPYLCRERPQPWACTLGRPKTGPKPGWRQAGPGRKEGQPAGRATSRRRIGTGTFPWEEKLPGRGGGGGKRGRREGEGGGNGEEERREKRRGTGRRGRKGRKKEGEKARQADSAQEQLPITKHLLYPSDVLNTEQGFSLNFTNPGSATAIFILIFQMKTEVQRRELI